MQYAVDEFNIVHRKRICDANIKYTINLIDEFEAFYSLQFIKCDFRFESQGVKIFITKHRNRNHWIYLVCHRAANKKSTMHTMNYKYEPIYV